MIGQTSPSTETAPEAQPAETADAAQARVPPKEVGGRDGPEPTRYGDWEKNGRCIDF
ncbi:MAG: DUF1674 domain-containing protein [Pseudoxanthomonas sp.]